MEESFLCYANCCYVLETAFFYYMKKQHQVVGLNRREKGTRYEELYSGLSYRKPVVGEVGQTQLIVRS